MSQLTWKDLAAPDLSGSLQGYSQFTNLLNSALGNAKSTIQGIQDERAKSTDSAVTLAIAQEQDPTKLKAALANPATFAGINASDLSASTIAALGSRPGQLLTQANQELALNDNTYLSNQMHTLDDRAPQLAEEQRLATLAGQSSDGQKAYDAFRAANPDLLKGIGWKASNEFSKDLTANQQAGINLLSSKNNLVYAANNDKRAADQNLRSWNEDKRQQGEYSMRQTKFGWETTDRNVDQTANAMLANIVESSDPNNKESVRNAIFNGPLASADPRIRALVYSRLPPALAGALGADELAAGIGATAGGGGSGSDGTFDSVISGLLQREGGYVANDAGKGASNFGINATANPNENIKGMTASRATEIYRTKYWNPIAAAVPAHAREAAFDFGVTAGPETSVKLWNQSGGDLNKFNQLRLGHYERLAREDPAKYGKYLPSWRSRVAETSGRSGGSGTPGVQASIALRRGQEAAGRGDATALVQAGSVDSNPNDIVAQLRAPGSRFAGTDAGFVRRELDAIVSQGTVKDRNGNSVQRINYAQAAILLDRHASANTGATSEWLHPSSWNIFNMGNSVRVNKQGDRIDRTALANDIAGLKKNDLVPRANREQSFRTASGNVAANQAAASKAYAELNSLLMRLPTQPGLAAQVQQARAKHAAMQQILEASQAQVNSDNGVAAAAPEAGVGSRASQMWNDITSGGLFSVRRN